MYNSKQYEQSYWPIGVYWTSSDNTGSVTKMSFDVLLFCCQFCAYFTLCKLACDILILGQCALFQMSLFAIKIGFSYCRLTHVAPNKMIYGDKCNFQMWWEHLPASTCPWTRDHSRLLHNRKLQLARPSAAEKKSGVPLLLLQLHLVFISSL